MDFAQAIEAFFTSGVDLAKAPRCLRVGAKWWDECDGWLYPFRITKADVEGVEGYPCGDPVPCETCVTENG